ncbi:MAG: lyso-ornithine lipid acyltransferase, partial [Porphyrobacter sp. HL-46]
MKTDPVGAPRPSVAEQRDWDLRLAAARGEITPVSPIGWVRIALRALALI